MRSSWWRRSWRQIVLIGITCIALVPFVLMVLTSIKPPAEAVTAPPTWFFTPTLENFKEQLTGNGALVLALKNSILIGLVTTIVTVFLSLGTGYGLTHFNFRGKSAYTNSFLALRAIPPVTFVLPYYLLWRELHLLGTYFALVIMYLTLCLPLAVWMMVAFFSDIPTEIEEACALDGCTTFQSLRYVLIPMLGPGIAATAGLCFILVWNEFLFALFTTTVETRTLPAELYSQLGYFSTNWGGLSSVGVISAIPVVIFVAFLQRYIVRGLAGGAVKG